MKLSWHAIGQGLASFLQMLNILGKIAPPKYEPYVTAGLTLVQGAAAIAAHFSNPDGSPASIAYVKPQKPVE